MANEKATTEIPTTEQGTEPTQEEPKQRTVSELLKLNTYQGMTDEEIKSLIDYYADMARDDETIRQKMATYNANAAELTKAQIAETQRSNQILESLLANPPVLGTIEVGD